MTKTKKILLGFLIGFSIPIITLIWDKVTFGKPSHYVKCNLAKKGDTQTFNFSNPGVLKEIGFFLYSDDLINGFYSIDGNFTIEYIKNDTVIETKISTKEALIKAKHQSVINHTSSGYTMIPIDVNKKESDSVRITVNKQNSDFKDMKGSLYIYFQKYKSSPFQKTPEVARKERLLKSSITDHETNASLLSLRHALDNKNKNEVKSILLKDNNISVNTSMMHDKHPLHFSAFHNDVSTTQMLIEQGAILSHKDKLGKNALSYAIENNATNTIKLLLDHNMSFKDIEFVNQYLPTYDHHRGWHTYDEKFTPLSYAVSIGSYELTKILLEHNERRESVDGKNTYLAYRYMEDIPNFRKITPLLLEYGLPYYISEKDMLKQLSSCNNHENSWCEEAILMPTWQMNPLEAYFDIYQQQGKLKRKKKLDKLEQKLENGSLALHTNGYILPNRPEHFKNTQSLLGIDINENGVRDDIERLIYLSTTTKVQVLRELYMQFAKANQAILADPNYIQNAAQLKEQIHEVYNCKKYIDKTYPRMKLWQIYDDNFIQWQIFDTLERSRVKFEWQKALGDRGHLRGRTYPLKDSCDFNITKYFN